MCKIKGAESAIDMVERKVKIALYIELPYDIVNKIEQKDIQQYIANQLLLELTKALELRAEEIAKEIVQGKGIKEPVGALNIPPVE